jgi:hypothetical protein
LLPHFMPVNVVCLLISGLLIWTYIIDYIDIIVIRSAGLRLLEVAVLVSGNHRNRIVDSR